MKYLVVFLLLSIIIYSCKKPKDYEHTYNIKVVYSDNVIDTLIYKRVSFNGNSIGLYIKTKESGIITNTKLIPCLVSHCGFYTENIACYVKRFEIISDTKILYKP